jgi:hypothetical protein
MQNMTAIRKDFVASHVRSLITTLKGVLNEIENENGACDGYTQESLKKVETDARHIRKLCMN